MPGTIELGRGERETRGEHRGRGERLSSDSRFVFVGTVSALALALCLALPAAVAAQDPQPDSAPEPPSRITFGLRASGLFSTRLIADNIGQSILPDTVVDESFRRDSISVTTAIAPDLTFFAGLTLNEETTVQLAAGYSFSALRVEQSEVVRDAGSLAVGHAVVAVQKPVRGFIGRVGAGLLWMHGGEVGAVDDMRAVNPVIEVAMAKRWPWRGFDVDLGLAGQCTQLSSSAIEARGGLPGFVYRAGIELGIARSFAR